MLMNPSLGGWEGENSAGYNVALKLRLYSSLINQSINQSLSQSLDVCGSQWSTAILTRK